VAPGAPGAIGSSRPYRGEPVGCTWCSFEVNITYKGPVAPLATRLVLTEQGERELCEFHAERGHWRARGRRVSAVA